MATQEKNSEKLTPEQATSEVYRLFCRGLNHEHIIERAREDNWGLSVAALSTVIENASARLIETAAGLNLDTEVGKALRRLEDLFTEAKDAKDTKTALAVEKEIISLMRLREHIHNKTKVPVPLPRSSPDKESRILKFRP